jgi:hypothetical protein
LGRLTDNASAPSRIPSRYYRLLHPRFGIDRAIAFILKRLRDFYGAQFSLIVLADSDGKEFRLQRSGTGDPDESARFDPLLRN